MPDQIDNIKEQQYAPDNMSLWGFFRRCIIDKQIDFKGRARPKEFWGFFTFYVIFFFITLVVGFTLDIQLGNIGYGTPDIAYCLAAVCLLFMALTTCAGVSVAVRRLKDWGQSIILLFAVIIPFVGWIIVFALMMVPSSKGANKYGPSPLDPPDAAV